MTMTMRKTFSAAAIVAVLSCSAAHAQVLGGAVGGAVNGAAGGGLGNSSVFGGGNAAGSFGGQLDTGSMIQRTHGAADRTRGVVDQTTRRARRAARTCAIAPSRRSRCSRHGANVATRRRDAAQAAKTSNAQYDECRGTRLRS
jgi:predicted lipid-binding transport protein (Tim44 family)